MYSTSSVVAVIIYWFLVFNVILDTNDEKV